MTEQRKSAVRTDDGFTVIEISIVLVIIGLLLSGSLLAIGPVLDNARLSETNQKLDKVEQALRLYAIRFGCLPCPADGDIASGAANDGEAQDGGGGYYTTGCTTNAACRAAGGDSVVPWITLGLVEADITDGWGSRISYVLSVPASNLVHQENATALPCPALGVETAYSGASICRGTTGYPAGNFTVNDVSGVAVTTAALYVLVSHGPDRSGARAAVTGTTLINPSGSANQDANADGASPFVQGAPITASGANYFDDIVRWRTAPVFVQSCGPGACGN